MSSAHFRLIADALDAYSKETGIDIAEHPFATELQVIDSSDEVFRLLEAKAKGLKDYRGEKLTDCLRFMVNTLYILSDALGEAVSLASFPPAKMIFVGLHVLLTFTSAITSGYDALVGLFEPLESFLKPVQILSEIPNTASTAGVILKIMVEVLSVLSIATKQVEQGELKSFAEKLFGSGDIGAVLQRLNRLTRDEARMTVVQILEVVHGLVYNMKVALSDGESSLGIIRPALVTMHETVDAVNQVTRGHRLKRNRRWLAPPDPSMNYNIARDTAHEGTAMWFFQNSTFRDWKVTGSLLWIHGIPGSGKSVLCSSIIHELMFLREAGLALVTYFFFDFRDLDKQRLREFLSSLLCQLSASSDLCSEVLFNLYSSHDEGARLPSDDSLTRCLLNMLQVQGQPEIYIIVDALDECPNDSGMPTPRNSMLDFLKALVDLRLPNVHICVASRPEVDIQDVLKHLVTFSVSLHDQSGQKKDILSYINAVVCATATDRRWRDDDKQLAIDILSDKADGGFRWVFCQLEILRDCFPPSIRRTLNEMPKSLDETYERVLSTLNKRMEQFAYRLFQCLLVSVRPLRVEELADILAVDFDAESLPMFIPDRQSEHAEEAVLSTCSSLITLVDVNGSRVVQFSHFSVREFLTSNRLATTRGAASRFHIVPHLAHTTLAQASLSILYHLDDHIDKDSIEQFPLADYAARHWVDHVKFGDVSPTIQGAMERLFDPDRPHFSAWVWIYDMDRPWENHLSPIFRKQSTTAPLYYAALCGFRHLVEHLIASGPRDINDSGGYYKTPLLAALAKGHIDTALSLLTNGAEINVLDDEGLSPLHRASRDGHHDIVELLLRHGHGADVNAQNGRGDTPLAMASSNGELKVSRLLLDHGADVNRRNEKEWTPLHLASRYGHLETARALINHGADVNAQQENLWTALHLAIAAGNLDVAHLLVEHGASIDRNQKEKPHLNLASGVGKLEVVQSLIGRGTTASSCDENGWTPLHTAVQKGHLDFVEKLLKCGADINVRGENGDTPLDLASGGESVQVVGFLVEHGAEVNSCDHNGWTPLHTASRNGNLLIVRLLLNNGADVNARNADDQTPLALAAENGGVEVSRLLIERGADVNSSDNKGQTSLRSASRSGHLEVVRLLLHHGADANSQSGDMWSPLHLATATGHLKIAGLLIQYGADVDRRNENQDTALILASKNGKLEVARLLLKCGSKVNSQENKGWTPLHSALQAGHFDVARLLLEYGANVDLLNHANETPLDLASGDGKHEVAYFLGERKGQADARNSPDLTSSHGASQPRQPDPTQSSLNRGEDRNISDNEERTPMHVASRNGQLPVLWSLLGNGAGVNERNADYQTPLDVASSVGKLIVASWLIDNGADVNSRCDAGWTPLHKASQCGHLDIVRLLLDHGAEVNVREQERWTPLHLASYNGYTEIVQLLLEMGADVHTRNFGGQTPFQVASASGHLMIAQLLLEYGAHWHEDTGVATTNTRRPTPMAATHQVTHYVFVLQLLAVSLAYIFR